MNSYLKIIISSAAGLVCASGQIRQPGEPQDQEAETLRVYRTWTTFLHPRFGFELPIPPGVSAVGSPEAASEPQFQSADQNFVMYAWGGITTDLPSSVIAAQLNLAQRKPDRTITYQQRGTTWFVVSGTDVRGMEFYEKFIMRGQHLAALDITFPRSRLRQYESWVERIEDGFRPVALRDRPLEFAQQSSRSRTGARSEGTPAAQTNSPSMARTTTAPIEESKRTEQTPEKLTGNEVAPTPDKTSADRMPTADKIAGKPGFVYSPFGTDHRLVDVTGVPSGTKVKCPYTMKIFRVP